MKKMVVLMALASLAACKKVEKKVNTNTSIIGTACTAAGSNNCEGTNLLICSNSKWTKLQDCATSGKTCGTDAGGHKACVGTGGGTVCDQSNTAMMPALYYDPTFGPYQEALASNPQDQS